MTGDLEKELQKLIDKHYGKQGDDTSEAFTEGLDYVHQEVNKDRLTLHGNAPRKLGIRTGNCVAAICSTVRESCRMKFPVFSQDVSPQLNKVTVPLRVIKMFSCSVCCAGQHAGNLARQTFFSLTESIALLLSVGMLRHQRCQRFRQFTLVQRS